MKTRSFYHLPLSSLQWLLSGLFLSAIPLWGELPAALLFGFLGCLLWRFILEKKGLKCPGLWMRCAVGLVGLLMILGLVGGLIGLAPGMGFLLLLIALKVLEMRTEREFMLLGFLSFFILLTALFFSQTLLVCFYVSIVFVFLTSTIVQFTGGAADGLRNRALLGYTSTLVLQALPLIILFFIFLPRMNGGGWLKINKPKAAQSGMSDQINPGSFAELAQSEEDAFGVEFPDGNTPPYNDLYWRVAVFTECYGLSWRPSPRNREAVGRPVLTPGPLIVQRVVMEPHTGYWAYSLDRPLQVVGNIAGMTMGNVLSLTAPSAERMSMVVTSQLGNDLTPLSDRAKIFLTQVPDNLSQRTYQLVNSWKRKTTQPRELAKLALAMFRKENFRYTLTPGTYSADGVDEFLFERRLGFCEHYAAAFATLMRVAGLPSRMVAGYHGGENNPFSDYMIVSQADAHAWVEVWMEGEGWVRIDPVDYINPRLVDADTPLAARLPTESMGEEGRSSRNGQGVVQELLKGMRLGWDAVNFQWNLHIVSYDQASQRDFYKVLGIRSLFSWKLISILLGGILFVLAIVYLFVRQRPEKKDRSLVLYHTFCRLLSRHGLVRGANEGPRDYTLRAQDYFPENAAKIMELGDLFIALRYAKVGKKPSASLEGEISARLQELKRTLRRENVAKSAPANH